MIARFSTRRLLAVLVASALVVVAAPALAQAPAPPNPNPSPNAVLLAKEIIDLKGGKQTIFDPLVRGVIEKTKEQFMQTNFMWAKDLNEVAAGLEKDYAPRVDELVDMSARIYASHFTEAELKQLLAFYQTPVGRKAITEEPKALDESMASGGQWGENLSDEVVVKIRDEMKKRGHDL